MSMVKASHGDVRVAKECLKPLRRLRKPKGNGSHSGTRRGRAIRVRLIGDSKHLEGD